MLSFYYNKILNIYILSYIIIKEYIGNKILFSVSLFRMTLLLGPPGSGKTTLLQALAGKMDKDLRVCHHLLNTTLEMINKFII
jgi:ABC-type multidrug transport system ATPase subunit